MSQKVLYAAITILLIGVLPLPYGYYTFLRIVITGVFIWAALIAFNRNIYNLKWVFVAMAILFNPIITVSFTKEIWITIDIIVAGYLFYVKEKIKKN